MDERSYHIMGRKELDIMHNNIGIRILPQKCTNTKMIKLQYAANMDKYNKNKKMNIMIMNKFNDSEIQ